MRQKVGNRIRLGTRVEIVCEVGLDLDVDRGCSSQESVEGEATCFRRVRRNTEVSNPAERNLPKHSPISCLLSLLDTLTFPLQ